MHVFKENHFEKTYSFSNEQVRVERSKFIIKLVLHDNKSRKMRRRKIIGKNCERGFQKRRSSKTL